MFKAVTLTLALIALAGCSQGRDSQKVGSVLDPLCAPDGSVVYVQYSDSKGEFNDLKASRANCAWNK